MELSANAHHTRVIFCPTAKETRWGDLRLMERVSIAAALAFSLAAPHVAAADAIYSYVDANGVTQYTNVPHHAGFRVVAGSEHLEHPLRAARVPLKQTSEFDTHIDHAARKYGVAPPLLKAVMAAESNFDPGAVSVKGATGLMQLMPRTAQEMFVLDILDPKQNIDGGARYLRQLLDEFVGDLPLVLAAYNAGPDRVRRSGNAIPAIAETKAYVRRVLELYEAYGREGDATASKRTKRAATAGDG